MLAYGRGRWEKLIMCRLLLGTGGRVQSLNKVIQKTERTLKNTHTPTHNQTNDGFRNIKKHPSFSVNVFSYRNAKVYWQLCLEPALYNQQSPTRIPGNWSALEGLPRGQRSCHPPTPPNVLSQNTSQATLSSSGALPELQRKQINVRNQYSMNCIIGRKGWEYHISLSNKYMFSEYKNKVHTCKI